MEAIKEPDWNTVGILGAAGGAAQASTGSAIGTDHLLAGITSAKGPARTALADAGATRTVVAALLRNAADRGVTWTGDDDEEGSVAARDVVGEDGGRNTRFTGAAAKALTAAMEQARREDAKKFTAVHLLRALLDQAPQTDPDTTNRATGLLHACGASPLTVLSLLDGGPGPGEDDLDPLLHPTRDILLGRAHYRPKVLWKRWLLKRMGVNWASRPAWWVSMETPEQAHRLGHDTVGTEHILLAILATHEVAHRYPHMTDPAAPTPDPRFTAGEHLAGLGLDHATVHHALTTAHIPLPPDPHPTDHYLDETTPTSTSTTADPGTGPLLDALLKEKTRARHLIETLTATP